MDKVHFKRAIRHLADLGDTDILPPLFEFQFFNEEAVAVVKRLLVTQTSDYNPVGVFEILSPKTQTSFRIAHQLYATDTLLFTSAAIEIAGALDERRLEPSLGAFSYRFDENPDSSSLFHDTCTFHDWLVHVSEMCEPKEAFANDPLILETDISDFYGRIYFHRIEHVLDDIGAANAPRRVIENIIKNSRARQSYGLPVGGAASRIIAEGVLIDVDTMLRREGLKFTRFVDDFRIMVESPAAAHTALCRLAEHLMLTEGLSLNAAKTRIVPASTIAKEIANNFSDVFTTEERSGLDVYLTAIYDGEEVTDVLSDTIKPDVLLDKLQTIIKSEKIDYTSVKLILKALRATGIDDALNFISNFAPLLYFVPRDFCILIGSLAQRTPEYSNDFAEALILTAKGSPFKDMALVRIWVSHLFVAGALPVSDEYFKALSLGGSTIEKRQRILLKGRLGDRAFFREGKTKFADLSQWEKPAMMLGASCLAKSEYETWLGFCVGKHHDILASEFTSWLKKNRENLNSKLNQDFRIKSRNQRISEMFLDEPFGDITTSIFTATQPSVSPEF